MYALFILDMVNSVCAMFSIPTIMENVAGMLHELATSCSFDRAMESCESGTDGKAVGFHVWSQLSRIENR